MPMLAFFPWLQLTEVYKFGDFTLIPYTLGKAKSYKFPEIIDGVLSPYKHSYGHKIKETTLIQYKDEEITREFSDDEVKELYQLGEIITLSGLANRAFFRQVGQNTNSQAFSLVIQKFNTEKDGVAVHLRRRDGYTLNYIGRKGVTFMCPIYVHSNQYIGLGKKLITSLLKATQAAEWDSYFEAIFSFNQASTDSPQVQENTELVLMNGAFEQILGFPAGTNAANLAAKFVDKLSSFPCEKSSSDSDRGLDNNKTLRENWIRDLYVTRGDLGHGRSRPRYASKWSLREHLLIGSFIFPSLVALKLASEGHYQLSEADKRGIRAIDYILSKPNLFVELPDRYGRQSPWNIALNEVERVISREAMREVVSAALTKEEQTTSSPTNNS